MPRSHPATLITLVRATVRDYALIARGATVLVAVSGGADSMALLHVLGLLRRELAFGLFAHGVDHGLRPEAAAELDVAQGFARLLDVPFDRHAGPRPARAATCRRARGRPAGRRLRAAASRAGATRIATGHHADDRAETMLMRILRGTRARHLGVLPPLDGDRIRPMLPARRTDIDAHVRRHRIPYCNRSLEPGPSLSPARVRLELLPALERLNPRVVEHMYALADELGQLGSTSSRRTARRANRRLGSGIRACETSETAARQRVESAATRDRTPGAPLKKSARRDRRNNADFKGRHSPWRRQTRPHGPGRYVRRAR